MVVLRSRLVSASSSTIRTVPVRSIIRSSVLEGRRPSLVPHEKQGGGSPAGSAPPCHAVRYSMSSGELRESRSLLCESKLLRRHVFRSGGVVELGVAGESHLRDVEAGDL